MKLYSILEQLLNRKLLFLIFTLFYLLSCDNTSQSELDEKIIDIDSSILQFIVDTKGKEILDEPKIPAILMIKDNNDTLYNGHIGIELRGSTSQVFFDKKIMPLLDYQDLEMFVLCLVIFLFQTRLKF